MSQRQSACLQHELLPQVAVTKHKLDLNCYILLVMSPTSLALIIREAVTSGLSICSTAVVAAAGVSSRFRRSVAVGETACLVLIG